MELASRATRPGSRTQQGNFFLPAGTISACLPESVGRGFSRDGTPEGSQPPLFAARGCRPVGGTHPAVRSITDRRSLPSLDPFPRRLVGSLCSRPSLAGRRRGYFRSSSSITPGEGRAFRPVGAPSATGTLQPPRFLATYLFGPSLTQHLWARLCLRAFISTHWVDPDPELLAPDRRDAGSPVRRVGSRRSTADPRIEVYVCPPGFGTSPLPAMPAWGSRPMVRKHRVMSATPPCMDGITGR